MSDETVVEIPEVVVNVVKREGLNEQSGKSLIAAFAPFHAQITAALETSKTITDGESVASQKVARTCRLELRRLRCEIENVRKDAKADALRYGKAVDGLANVLKFLCEPEENRLEEIEKYAERKEAARVAQIVADRTTQLMAVECDPAAYNLATMTDETFAATLDLATRMRNERIKAERKAEADRVAKAKAEAEERERMRAENERLKAEAEAREKALAIERAKAETERQRIEAERAKERKELEAKAKAEAEAREKAEAEAAEAKRKADADAACIEAEKRALAEKEANTKHRTKIMNQAFKSLTGLGIEKDVAITIVKAIADGKVDKIRMVW